MQLRICTILEGNKSWFEVDRPPLQVEIKNLKSQCKVTLLILQQL